MFEVTCVCSFACAFAGLLDHSFGEWCCWVVCLEEADGWLSQRRSRCHIYQLVSRSQMLRENETAELYLSFCPISLPVKICPLPHVLGFSTIALNLWCFCLCMSFSLVELLSLLKTPVQIRHFLFDKRWTQQCRFNEDLGGHLVSGLLFELGRQSFGLGLTDEGIFLFSFWA